MLLDELKRKAAKQIKFWQMVLDEAGQVDPAKLESIENFADFLDPHVDGWGHIQGPNQIDNPIPLLRDCYHDENGWPDFCPACLEAISECRCQVEPWLTENLPETEGPIVERPGAEYGIGQ